MIDYINIECLDFNPDVLLKNQGLNFHVPLNVETGEILKINNNYIKKNAHLDNFKIELITNESSNLSRLNLKGSIHKYWQNGTNYNDFDLHSLKMALFDLFKKLDIDIRTARIHSFEFGVNVTLPYSCAHFLNSIVSYKGKQPQNIDYKNKGQMIKFVLSQYIVKIYNKGLQYFSEGKIPTNDDNLLRFEIHVDKMYFVQSKGIEIYTIMDIFEPMKLKLLGELLTSIFDDLIVCHSHDDVSVLKPKETAFLLQCRNPKFWSEIKSRKNPKEYIRTKDRYRKLINSNVQNEIKDLIKNKWEYLLKNVPLLPSVDNNKMSDCYPYIVSNKQTDIKKCIVTQLDIAHQKNDSRFLSEQSINEIQNNDLELYYSLLKKYGPKNLKENINYLIAHNIRNAQSNGKHNFLRKYKRAESQTTLFDLKEVLKLTDHQTEILNSYYTNGNPQNTNRTTGTRVTSVAIY
jgi:hypothetical protein